MKKIYKNTKTNVLKNLKKGMFLFYIKGGKGQMSCI